MMQVTFLAHSGFFIELDTVCLLLDWWTGALPRLPEGKPLLCFASHQHHDHFHPQIFALDDGTRPVRFVLGQGIQLSPRNREAWKLSGETARHCTVVSGNATLELPWGVTVETLPSTDEGVAFLITCGQTTLYHAGDLNWWHWMGEPDPWNPDMERDFKAYIEPLRGRRITLALAPLDPRQEQAAGWGLKYLLDLAEVKQVIPMHQWEQYHPTHAFLEAYPQYGNVLLPVSHAGQAWTL